MKPTFREAADERLAALKFSDDMKLAVLAGCRRRRFPAARLLIAAACIVLLAAGAGMFMHFRPSGAPDTVAAPGYPVGQRFSSPSCDLVIDSYEWNGYDLTIGFTVTSRADYRAIMIRSPFESEGKLVESTGIAFRPYAENALVIDPGERVHFTIKLRMNNCAPGMTFPIRMQTDFLQPISDIIPAENVPEAADAPMLVSEGDITADIISGTYADRYGDIQYIDWPTPVWAHTADRNYAVVRRMPANEGLVYDNSEKIDISLTVTVPSTSRTGTLVTRSTTGNGLFYVTIESAVLTPTGSALQAVIVPAAPLTRKESYDFTLSFTAAGGTLSCEYPIASYIIYNSNGEILIYFDRTLDFAPETITFTCEWTDGGASGVAEAAFDRSSY